MMISQEIMTSKRASGLETDAPPLYPYSAGWMIKGTSEFCVLWGTGERNYIPDI